MTQEEAEQLVRLLKVLGLRSQVENEDKLVIGAPKEIVVYVEVATEWYRMDKLPN